jgi:hypothetical protein
MTNWLDKQLDRAAQQFMQEVDPQRVVRAWRDMIRSQIADVPEPFKYEFKIQGASGPGQHCSHCPRAVGEQCTLSCASNYKQLQDERAAEGIVVVEWLTQ